MPIIPTRIHGVLDYVVSLFVAALPFLFGWTGGTRWAFVALGLFGVGYSLLTDYELSAYRMLPMRTHLMLDVVFIVVLLALAFLTPVAGLRVACVIVAIAAGLLTAFTRRASAG